MIMLKIGHIGAGGMARERTAAFLKQNDVRIVAGWSRSKESLEAYTRLSGARGASDWREVAGSPEVNAVCIATPTSTHAGFAAAAIENGKHVLIECPAVNKLQDLDDLARAAERSKVALYIGSNYRFDRVSQAVRCAMANLGEVWLAQGDSSWKPGHPSWYYDRELSGGVLLCVHLYQFSAFHPLGRVLWIEAILSRNSWCGVATAKHETGAIAIATGGFQSHGTNRFLVVGSEGVLRQQDDGTFILQHGGKVAPVVTTDANLAFEDNACFLRCVRGEEDWRVHLARERDILATALAAQQSAETEKRVML